MLAGEIDDWKINLLGHKLLVFTGNLLFEAWFRLVLMRIWPALPAGWAKGGSGSSLAAGTLYGACEPTDDLVPADAGRPPNYENAPPLYSTLKGLKIYFRLCIALSLNKLRKFTNVRGRSIAFSNT